MLVSESVRAGRDALLIRKRWRGSGLARQSSIGLHLFAWHYDSLSPRAELEAMVTSFIWSRRPKPLSRSPIRSSATPGAPHARRTPRASARAPPEYVGIAHLAQLDARALGRMALPMSGSKRRERSGAPNGGASPIILRRRMVRECTNEFSQQSLRHFPGHRAGFGFPRRLRRELLHATLFRSHGHAALRSAGRPFNKEFAQRGEVVVQQVENITNADVTVRMALDLARPNATLRSMSTTPTAPPRSTA